MGVLFRINSIMGQYKCNILILCASVMKLRNINNQQKYIDFDNFNIKDQQQL